jgi:hypothetical protein
VRVPRVVRGGEGGDVLHLSIFGPAEGGKGKKDPHPRHPGHRLGTPADVLFVYIRESEVDLTFQPKRIRFLPLLEVVQGTAVTRGAP